VTSVFVSYAKKHYFDRIESVDILDCNGGDHGYPFATNFNPRSTCAKFPRRAATGKTANGSRFPP
jgi:saccharopine dehydrogenase-like NADP-dependent oxidoreductase